MAENGSVLAAYQALLGGDPDPIVALLDPEIEWTESGGGRQTRTIRGCGEVAAELRARCGGAPIPLRGLAFTRSSITAEFDEPWWDDRPRWRRLISSALGARYTQTLTLSSTIERIENNERFVARTDPSDDRELLAMTLAR